LATLSRVESANTAMKDYQAVIEKLRREAAEAALIRDLATDKDKEDSG
jgi:hypothetical protein